MSKGAPNPLYGPVTGGTSLVDRMNLSIHLRKYIKIFGRRLWIVLICVAVGFGISYYRAKETPDVFQASSTLGIKPQLKTPFDSPVYMRELAEFHEAQLQYFRNITGRVNEKLADYRAADGSKPVIFSKDPAQGPGSTFILTVQASDFGLAQEYARLWAREFIRFKNEQKENALDSEVVETRNSIARYQSLLDQARREMDDFRKKYNIGNIEDAGQAEQQRLNRLNAELDMAKTARQKLENQTAEELADSLLKRKDSNSKNTDKSDPLAGFDTSSAGGYDPAERYAADSALGTLEFNVRKRKAEIEDWSTRLLPEHPYMVKLQKELEVMERELKIQKDLIAERRKEWVKTVEAQKLARIESLQRDEKSLQKIVDESRAKVLESSDLLYRYKALQEQEQLNKAALEQFNRKLMVIDQGSAADDVIVIMQEGVGGPDPVAPNRPKIITNGTLSAFGLGLVIVFLLHRLDDRLELAEDIEEELEEPVLGQVPQEDLKTLKDGRLLITNLDEHNMFAESIRGVRSAILFGSAEHSKKVIITTSAVPGDGKTTFTVNFAATLANAGNRVLLVDCDLRRGNIHGYFQVNREPGLTEVLSGQVHWSDVVNDTPLSTLKIISTGKLPGNPGELLISPAMEEFVREAREEYDHILFDCPPVTAIDDTFCLLNMADGLLFVVKAGQTSMRFAKNAIASVRQRGAHIFGIVLNGITTDHPSYYYNYYYHAYYRANKESDKQADNVRPAKKLASKGKRLPSIEAEAHARSGQHLSTSEIAAHDHKKAEEFKLRRAQKQAQHGGPGTENSGSSVPTDAEQKH